MENTNNKIIVRFAPSPTGFLHIGSARVALFNYLFAKQNQAKFILRIEDTDKERSTPEYTQAIFDGLNWLGLDYDGEVLKQSERGEVYKKYLQKLITENKAYLSKEEVKEEGQRAEVIRFRNPNKKVVFQDLIRGQIEFDTTELGDFVIAKSLAEPIFHLAVVVDDFESGVTHIIRGEDHISNTPRHILLQEALGAPTPIYAHLPLILSEQKEKLSKRKHGAMVSLEYYKDNGYLKEALINFIAFLGWNPGDERELFTLPDLIKDFNLTKVQKSGAIFNRIKLNWFNKEYIKRLPVGERETLIMERLDKVWPEVTAVVKSKLLPILTDRISYFAEVENIIQNGEFDFLIKTPDFDIQKVIWKGETTTNTMDYLKEIQKIVTTIPEADFGTETGLKASLWPYAEAKGRGNILWPLRYALSGLERSPDPFVLMKMLGREESLKRLSLAERKLSSL